MAGRGWLRGLGPGLILTALAGIAGAAALVWFHDRDEAARWETHKNEVRLGLLDDTRQRVEFFFHNTYETARTISLIPGVQNLQGGNRTDADEDVVAEKRLGEEADVVIRNLYRNLVSNFTISEIYCVLDGFTPDQTPFFMYDGSIVGTTQAQDAQDPADVPEASETEEYAAFPGILAGWKADHPQPAAQLEDIPIRISGPMLTCDNTQYLSVKTGDPEHTRGLAATVPLYTTAGDFRGMIAVIYRLDTLKALLLGIPYLPVTPEEAAALKDEYHPEGPGQTVVLTLPESSVTLTDPRSGALADRVAAARDAGDSDLLTAPLTLPGAPGARLEYLLTAELKSDYLAPGRRALGLQLAGLAGLALLTAAVTSVVGVGRRRRSELLAGLTEAVDAVGTGHLGAQLPGAAGGRGQAAVLGTAFVRMVASIREMVQVLRDTLEASSRVSQDLAASSVEASATLETIQRSLANIAEVVVALEGLVVETMEANFEHAQAESMVRTQVDALVERIGRTAIYVESSLTSFQAASETMTRQAGRLGEFRSESRDARERIDESSAQLGRVEQESDRIGEAVALIADITAKTKVLAINAAIEAARAGSAGAGFGVVSQNIRALAEETEARNSSISAILGSLQAALTGARSSQDWTRDHLARLLSDFESLGQDLAEVSENMRELGQGSHEVLDELTKTREGGFEVVRALNIMTDGSERLVTKIGELVELAQTTSRETRSVETALGAVGEVVQLVTQAGATNLEGVESLRRQVGRFRD